MRQFVFVLFATVIGTGSLLAQKEDPKPLDPTRWENDMKKFEAQDEASPPPKGALLFVGSSSIRLWELKNNFPSEATINRGFGGSTIADSVHYFDLLVARHQPKAILMYAGDNDVAHGLTPAEVAADFEKFAGLVSEKLPGTPVIYIAIKPSRKRWEMWPTMKDANDRIAAWCAKHDHFYFADIGAAMLADAEAGQPPAESWFRSDGLHLSPEGYAGWTKVIRPIIDEALKK
ncbi:MAG: hypothetical protein KDN19_06170 [Verrucomicrobiae bacterium]|nr:hypothetical protein [Verrucomicrobiae bacterium]